MGTLRDELEKLIREEKLSLVDHEPRVTTEDGRKHVRGLLERQIYEAVATNGKTDWASMVGFGQELFDAVRKMERAIAAQNERQFSTALAMLISGLVNVVAPIGEKFGTPKLQKVLKGIQLASRVWKTLLGVDMPQATA